MGNDTPKLTAPAPLHQTEESFAQDVRDAFRIQTLAALEADGTLTAEQRVELDALRTRQAEKFAAELEELKARTGAMSDPPAPPTKPRLVHGARVDSHNDPSGDEQ